MGERYQFNKENDELLSEAERAFDITARREAVLKNAPAAKSTAQKSSLKTFASLFSLGMLAGRAGGTHAES